MLPASAEPLIFQGLCYDKMGQQPKGRGCVARRGSRGPRCLGATLPSGPAGDGPRSSHGRHHHFRKAIAKIPANASWKASCIFNLAKRSS